MDCLLRAVKCKLILQIDDRLVKLTTGNTYKKQNFFRIPFTGRRKKFKDYKTALFYERQLYVCR